MERGNTMGKLPEEFALLKIKYMQGASDEFEKICGELMQAKYGANAHRIVPRHGDLGIDIIIGDFTSPCIICQCKFFSENIGKSQQDQIRKSFGRAADSKEYSMKKWVLFLANIMDPPEFNWWSKWQAKKSKEYRIEIELYDGARLIFLLKKYQIYEHFFGKQGNCPSHENALGSFGSSGLFLINDEVVKIHSTPSNPRIISAFRRISTELENILYAVCSGAASECILEDNTLTLVDYLEREINNGAQMILLLGNGGIGKTTALVQTAVRMHSPNRTIYLLRMGKPQNQDVAALDTIRQSIQNQGQDLEYSYLLFIDNPYANSEVLGEFLEEIQINENVQVIINERMNRFSSIAEELLHSIYKVTLRVVRVGFTNERSSLPFADNNQVVNLKMSVSWKRQIVLDMFRSIPGVNISKIESVIDGKRDMSIIELYLRTCIKYNKMVDDQDILSTSVKVNLDWDEWINLVRTARGLPTHESTQLESVFQIVAALDIFKVKASLKMLSLKTQIPADRLETILHSLLTTASYEPMWYENSGDMPYLKLKHDVISYLYFEERGINPQITLESLIDALWDEETILSFEKQVFKRRYIQCEYGDSPPLNVNVKRLYELFAAHESFYAVLSHAGRAYSFDVARVWMIDVQDKEGAVAASNSWSVLLQSYENSEPKLRYKVYMCCRDDCHRRGIPFPPQLLHDKDFIYNEALDVAKAGTDMTQIASIWNDNFELIYQTTTREKDIIFKWRKGIFDYFLIGFEMPKRFFDVLNYVSYQMIDNDYAHLESYVMRTRLDRRRYYDLGALLYAVIAKRNPSDIPSRMRLANCYVHLGDYRQAELIYEELLRNNPMMYTAHNALASLCAQWLKKEWSVLEDNQEEKQRLTMLFEKSINNAIAFGENYIDKARCYAVWGVYLYRTVRKFQESYNVLRKGLDCFELYSLHNELGMLCSMFSKSNTCYSINEAEDHFNRALKIDCPPMERLTTHVPYGNMLYCLGKLDEATAQYQKASKLGEIKADQMLIRIQRESQILAEVAKHHPHHITTLWDAGDAMQRNNMILSDMEKRWDVFSLLLDAVSGESTINASFSRIAFVVMRLTEARYLLWDKDLIKFRVIQKVEEYCSKNRYYAKNAQNDFRSQCFYIQRSIKIKQGNEYDLQLDTYETYLRNTSHATPSTD